MPQQHPSPTPQRPRGRTVSTVAAAAAAALVVAGVVAPAAEAADQGRTALPSVIPSWPTDPQAPTDNGAAPGSWNLSFRVYLAGQNAAGLARAAKAVSDPAGRSYAHYLTPAQFAQHYGPTAAQTAKVSDWLGGLGMHVTGSNAHYLSVNGTVAEVEQAFATSLHSYSRWPGALGYAPVSGVSVPAALGHDISTVLGLDNPLDSALPAPSTAAAAGSTAAAAKPVTRAITRPTTRAQDTGSAPATGVTDPNAEPCSQWWGQNSSAIPAYNGQTTAIDQVCGYTPQQLRAAYGVTDSPYTGKGRTVAVVLNGALPTMAADANRFFAAHNVPGFAPGQYSENFGPNFAATCRGESDAPEEPLDVESIHIAAPDAKVVYVGADCDTGDGGSLAYLDAHTRIVDQHLADVVTDSFSTAESTNTLANIAAWDQMFEQGALEGIGFDYASGDYGDGATGVNAGEQAAVIFPASDQWATSVGGTTLEIGKNNEVLDELGWGNDSAQINPQGTGYLSPPPGPFMMGSTGGRSALINEPWYQKGVVPDALTTAGGTAPAHREQPDISADGDRATGWLVGYTTPNGAYHEELGAGTSGSSPLIAGLEADAAQASGHALGFANPLLYAMRNTPAIRDIVPAPAGQAPLAVTYIPDPWSTPPSVASYLTLFDQDGALKAAPGYDDVTGVGSATADFVRLFARR
ncbi:S53 family peptidase [Kitasatospora sp. NBC_01266]|uniref:S53 family peptidase n=1 Tax=Kitasatospora sp. NBC_01266 TaxID=2903572 RepID=UPI002E34A230|nr:S53 family peptidase [Kitasatospora sp. NBC_01266]